MVLVGSSTINNGILTAVAGILEMMKGLKFTNKKAAAFGSYGWSGEAVKIITQQLKDAKFDVVNEGIRELWNPDEEALERCREYGRSLV
jgi:anaerobic nitric oxide reductase flavorubredoxin